MLFPTVTFGIFLAVVLTVNALLIGRPRAWTWAMLAASYVFYGWWDPRFLGLVVGLSLVSWAAGREIAGRHTPPAARRRWVVAAVTLDLVVLGFFKYYGFFAESLAGALQPAGITPPLPRGRTAPGLVAPARVSTVPSSLRTRPVPGHTVTGRCAPATYGGPRRRRGADA